MGARPPELILLDVRMPGIDGFEVCRRLKEDPALRDIPVIFLSAQSEADDKVRGFAAWRHRLHRQALPGRGSAGPHHRPPDAGAQPARPGPLQRGPEPYHGRAAKHARRLAARRTPGRPGRDGG
ncbi:response regulator [Massilia sp. H-1]|nr:response regulator [Massilia sp. H-1]